MPLFVKRLLLAAALLAGALAPAASDYLVKDANGNTITIKAASPSAGVQLPQSVPSDPTGVAYSTTNPLPVNVQAALPAGTNVLGAVTQSGAWTFGLTGAVPAGTNVIGGVTQSGTWNVTVNTALPTGANTIGAVTQASGPWSSNLTQVNGTALAVGHGVVSNGVQRVTIASDSTGRIAAGDSAVATYSYTQQGFVPAATPTNIFTFKPDGTKVMRLRRVVVTAYATTAGVMPFYVMRQTTADSGGTSAAITINKAQSTDAASTVTAIRYTANPTVGSQTFISAHYLGAGVPGSVTPLVIEFGESGLMKPQVFGGTTDFVAFAMGAGTLPAGFAMTFAAFWTEE